MPESAPFRLLCQILAAAILRRAGAKVPPVVK